MLELQLREIGARLSGEDEKPSVAGALTVEEHAWADSSYDLQRGLEVVELGAATLPVGDDSQVVGDPSLPGRCLECK